MNQSNLAAKFRFFFDLTMAIVYALAGVLLIFILHFDQFPAVNARIIGIVLLIYAAYRSYKLYKSYAQSAKQDAENSDQ